MGEEPLYECLVFYFMERIQYWVILYKEYGYFSAYINNRFNLIPDIIFI